MPAGPNPREPRNGRPVVRPLAGWLAALAVLAGCSAGPPPPASSPVVLSGAPADTSPDQDRGAGSDLDDGEAIVRLAQEAATTITDDQADLDVEDQSGSGKRVAIGSALLSDGVGFVAIYDADLLLLGITPVGSGTAPVSTALRVPVTTDQQLLAVLYRDDGDNRADPLADWLVLEEDGEVAAEDFYYRVSPRTNP